MKYPAQAIASDCQKGYIMRMEAARVCNQDVAEAAVCMEPPQGYLRLHHFMGQVLETTNVFGTIFARGASDGTIVDALIEQEAALISLICTFNAHAADFMPHSTQYDRDCFGDGTFESIQKQLRGRVAYAEYLHGLPDEAVLKLAVTKDSICTQCAIGRHCTALTMEGYIHPQVETAVVGLDTIAGEEHAKAGIIARLEAVLPGTDGIEWATGYEPMELYDENDAPVSVQAPYIVLTMRAARALLS